MLALGIIIPAAAVVFILCWEFIKFIAVPLLILIAICFVTSFIN